MFLPDTSTAEEPSPSPQSSLSLSNTTGLQQDLQCKSHSELSSIGIQNKHYTFPSTHNNSSTLSTHHTTVTSRTFIYSKVSLALRLHIPRLLVVLMILLTMASETSCQSSPPSPISTTQTHATQLPSLDMSTEASTAHTTSSRPTSQPFTAAMSSTTQTCSRSEVCSDMTAQFNLTLGDQCKLDEGSLNFTQTLNKTDCRGHSDNADDDEDDELLDYSSRTQCEACKVAYHQWLCSSASTYTINATYSIPYCEALVCQRARRLCPYLHGDQEDDEATAPGFLCNDFDWENIKTCYFFKDASLDVNKQLDDYTNCSEAIDGIKLCILNSASTVLSNTCLIIALVMSVYLSAS